MSTFLAFLPKVQKKICIVPFRKCTCYSRKCFFELLGLSVVMHIKKQFSSIKRYRYIFFIPTGTISFSLHFLCKVITSTHNGFTWSKSILCVSTAVFVTTTDKLVYLKHPFMLSPTRLSGGVEFVKKNILLMRFQQFESWNLFPYIDSSKGSTIYHETFA